MKPDWKYMLACVAALFIAISSVFACFVEDPTSSTSNPSASIVGGNGSSSDVTIPGENHPGTVVENPGWQVDPDDPRDDYSYALTVDAAFPLTLNVSFSGFLDEAGEQVDEPITRMCLLYFSTAGRWTILTDIKNPSFTVVGDAENKRALFGRHTIPSSLGYSSGEGMPVLLYFRTQNYENFNLEEVLVADHPKPLDNTVICIVNSGNRVPM